MTISDISLNKENIRRIGEDLGSLPLAADFAAKMVPEITVDDEDAYRAYLWTAAVCHGTKGGLHGTFESRFYKGWDFLVHAFSLAAQESTDLVSLDAVRELTDVGLRDILTRNCSDYSINLTDLDRRASILRTTAQEVADIFDDKVRNILDRSCQNVAGASGAYTQLARLSAFRDDQKKKSTAFLMIVHFSKRWRIDDIENILPMIDYHRMRLLLRTGCIGLDDGQLLRQLRDQTPVDGAVEQSLRAASMDVCSRLPEIANMNMFDFDVLLWAHARSCCRASPICVSRKPENDSFQELLAEDKGGRCVFEGWCPGASDGETRELWEPVVSTENY